MDHHPLPAVVPGAITLLIVDDVDVVRRSAARMLSEEGFRVFEAGSVEALTRGVSVPKDSSAPGSPNGPPRSAD